MPIAARVRHEAGLPVATAWGVDEAQQVETAVTTKQLDLVMIGRAHLANPHYTYQLALELGLENPAAATLPAPYAYWLSRYGGPGKGSAQ